MPNSPETPAPASASGAFHSVVFLVFLLSFGAAFSLLLSGSPPAVYGPPLAMVLLFAVATTLLSLSQSLPLQNVISIAAFITLVSGLVEIINLKTSLPFGHRVWTDNLGPQLFRVLPLAVPLIWIVNLLNSRGVARLVLGSWRTSANYGLLSLALTALLVGIFNLGLEHFAAAHHLWLWPGSKNLPWFKFPADVLVSVIILLLITPWLIVKKPAPLPPPDFHPLIVWLLLFCLLVASP